MPEVVSIKAGLIGAGIQASRSPSMHMEEGRALGLAYSYDLFDLDQIGGGEAALPRLLDAAEAGDYAGLNITHPCKQSVMPLLTQCSADAERLGAVNTVVFRDGARIGHNTDWFGFSENLARGLPTASLERVLVLGAGGAGAAVVFALLKRGAREVVVCDVDPARAAALAARLVPYFPAARITVSISAEADVRTCSGLVNCTPIGMAKHPGAPIDAALLRAELWVADAVYVPLETELLKAARARGCASLDGGGMAVFQAAEAISLITGRAPDKERMLERFNATLRA